MPLTRLIIKNYKSIKDCDISLSDLNVLIGGNGTGKTNLLDAISYFYRNLTETNPSNMVFDENNHYSNELRITLVYDLSEFVKISKFNSEDTLDIFEDQPEKKTKYGGYYKAIIAMASQSKDKKIRVELSQIKGRTIHWNCSYEDRLIFKSLFPMFYVDTRNLDITEWGYVWDVLGELAKVSNSERKIIEDNLSDILLDESKAVSRKLKVITEIFSAADVSVKPAISREFAKNLTKLYFSGDIIRQKGKQLGYYSTGTNSVKYIELLLKSIDAISKAKMKEPIVLFDEPEVSLHANYLDELADAMMDVGSKLSILASTHSARLAKNIITESETVALFNVKLINQYTHVQKMKKFLQYSPSSKYRVLDDHINSYFSRAILFVEGETELELFANPYLRILFPALKMVDVFKALSDKPILNIMNPSLTNIQTPYLCLIDMDKAINYNRGSKKFSLKGEYFQSDLKECFQYRSKHQTETYLYHQRERINAMAEKLHVHYYLPFLSCEDTNYRAFISVIQEYLLAYNVFVLSTTVEGMLINTQTLDFALLFLKQKKKEPDYNVFKVYWEGLPKTDRLNAMRIVYNGKTDLLIAWKTLSKSLLPDSDRAVVEKAMIGDKTSGWVSEYLDAFFQQTIKCEGKITEKLFRKYLDDEDHKKAVLKEFEKNFSELHSLISRICAMIYE